MSPTSTRVKAARVASWWTSLPRSRMTAGTSTAPSLDSLPSSNLTPRVTTTPGQHPAMQITITYETAKHRHPDQYREVLLQLANSKSREKGTLPEDLQWSYNWS